MKSLAKAAAVLLLIAGVVPDVLSRSLSSSQQDLQADVLIIGAGMAGVAAARNLTDAGYKVIVLEGRDRTGGRLVSIPISGGHVDQGAMWIHEGSAGNPLFDLVTQKLKLPISGTMDYSAVATFSPAGEKRSNRSVAYLRVAAAWYQQVLNRITRMRSSRTPDIQDVPLSKIYTEFLQANRFSADDFSRANSIMHSTMQVLLNANITALSTLRFGDAKMLPAVDVMLKEGFDAVVKTLSPGIDIRTGAVVKNVEYSAQGVKVTTAGGTVYAGRYAILTPSLGCLKDGDINFSPALPNYKTKAIQDLGFGVLDKTILTFPSVFWDKNADFIIQESSNWGGRWGVFLNYHKIFNMPVLVALHVADVAKSMEAQTDAELTTEAMKALRGMYGTSIPDPSQVSITRWAADPFSKGSYSYFAVGNPLDITAELAKPVGRLLFAGEATSNKPATVLGAWLSGQREAGRAAQLLSQEKAGKSV